MKPTEDLVIHKPPLIYFKLKKQFKVNWDNGIIITYFPHIYYKWNLNDAKYVHESVHLRQQSEMGVELWWDKYCADPQFRLSQEVEAYKAEVEFIRTTVSDTRERFKMIREIAKELAGPIYGHIIKVEDAIQLFA